MIELTYEEAEKILNGRMREYPVIDTLVSQDSFTASLKQTLTVYGLSEELLPLIEMQTKLVLGFFSPISLFPKNLQETLEISEEKAQSIATLIEVLIFESIMKELLSFDEYWKVEMKNSQQIPEADKNMKEKLELRPNDVLREEKTEGASGVRPLTREEVLKSIAPSRTMATDIASLGIKSGTLGVKPS